MARADFILHPTKRVHLYLSVGLAFAVIFGALAEDILTHDPWVNTDRLAESWLLSKVTPSIAWVFSVITLLGSGLFILLATTLLALWWLRKKDWFYAGGLLMCIGGGGLLNFMLKLLFRRPRPDFPNIYGHEDGFSFPSGHSMMSLLFYGFILYALIHVAESWKLKWRLVFYLGLIPLLVGVSRMVLGVHYPIDVLGGWSAGAMWLAVSLAACHAARRLT